MLKKSLFLPITLAIIIASIIMYLAYRMLTKPENYEVETYNTIINDVTKDIDDFTINDSLPYYEYARLKDSLDKIKNKEKNISASTGTSAECVGFIGTRMIDDNFNTTGSSTEDTIANKYYLSLQGYTFKNSEESFTTTQENFFVKNGKYYIRDFVKDSSIKKVIYGHHVEKEIPIRYSFSEKMILIPLSITTYKWVNVLITIFGFGLIAFGIFISLALPAKILLRISTGDVFTEKNLAALKLMSYGLLVITLLAILLPFCFHLYFKSMIPQNFTISFWETLKSYFLNIALILIVFAIYKAFKKGHNLQQEQDLTV